jgi:hypothetical protein
MRLIRWCRWLLALVVLGIPVAVCAQAVPPAATSPQPAPGATGVLANVTLTWTGTNATSFDVAFGTAQQPPSVATNVTASSYQPTIALVGGSTYYWSITPHNATGATAAPPVWSFTVGNTNNLPTTAASAQSTLQNLGFGVALSLQWNAFGPPIVTDATVDGNGIVRVNTRANTSPGFMLEMHYLPWKTQSKMTGFGPFVAVQPGGTDQIISAVGAGGMIDWKVGSDPSTRKGFGLGFGYAAIPAAKTLGDEFVPNQPAPTGPGGTPLPIRYETRDKGSILLVLSFTF